MTNKEKLVSIFKECWDNLDIETMIEIHNDYCSENGYSDDEIFVNDEDFFETMFSGKPFDAVRATYYGKYNMSDDYVWFNGYANLESGSVECEMPFHDVEEMAEFYMEEYNNIKHIYAMEDFYDACYYGLNDDEEED